MIPIVVSTKGGPTADVLYASIEAYAPHNWLMIQQSEGATFGEAYNDAMTKAFAEYNEIIIANDDVVLTPTTMSLLLEDVAMLKASSTKLGLVGTWADNVRGLQVALQPESRRLKETHVLSPIFAYISRAAFEAVKFPPINWFSDDVMCEDLLRLGYRHFISRAYVHHVGSGTIGQDDWRHYHEAMPWLCANRPEYLRKWFPERNCCD